jgi:polyisoprenoid-binding protein YceI
MLRRLLVLVAVLAAPVVAFGQSFAIDSVHSSTVFRIKHLDTAFFYGRFNQTGGTITWDEANPSASKFDISIAADSVFTGNEMREKHLKGPDFFDVQQFPTIRFVSTSLTRTGDNAYDLAGELTLHGVTKPITVKLTKTGTGKNRQGAPLVGFEAMFDVRRSEFGMTYMLNGLSDEVNLMVGLEAVQQ